MPEKISVFIDKYWPWIFSILTIGIGGGAAKAKLVTKKELYKNGQPIYKTVDSCVNDIQDCHSGLQETFGQFDKRFDRLESKMDESQKVLNQTLIDFAGRLK